MSDCDQVTPCAFSFNRKEARFGTCLNTVTNARKKEREMIARVNRFYFQNLTSPLSWYLNKLFLRIQYKNPTSCFQSKDVQLLIFARLFFMASLGAKRLL